MLAAAAAHGAPRLGPALPLDPTPGLEPLTAFTYSPNLAFTGAQYVMAWQDTRSGNAALYAAVVELDGGVANPGRRVLVDRDDVQSPSQPVGCRAGEELLWAGPRASGYSWLLRTTPELQRTSMLEVPSLRGVGHQLDCTGPWPLLLVSQNRYTPTDFSLHATFVQPDGGLLPVDGGFPLVDRLELPAERQVGTAVAFDGARYLAVWTDGRNRVALPDGGADDPSDISGAFIDAATRTATAPFAIAGGPGVQAEPQVAFDGTQFLVAWSEAATPGATRDLWARRVSSQGQLRPVVALATTPEDEREPRLVFDGTTVLATWGAAFAPTDVEVRAALVNGGQVQPAAPIARGWFDALRLISSGGGRALQSVRDFGRNIRQVGYLLQDGVRVAGPIDPATTVTLQSQPRAFAGPAGHAVLWRERAGVPGVLVLDGGVSMPRLASGSGRSLTGVGVRNDAVLALWSDRTAQWLGHDLSPTDAGAVRFGRAATSSLSPPRWDGEGFVVAGTEPVDGGTTVFLQRARLDGGVEPEVVLATTSPETRAVSVASAASGTTLTAWSPHYGVQTRCLRPDGGAAGNVALTSTAYEPLAQVASDGRGFLVAWYGTGVELLLLDEECRPAAAGPARIEPAVLSLYDPVSVAWDGRQYVVAFVSSRDPKGDVALVRVQTDGGVSAPVVVAEEPSVDEVQPSVSAAGPGHWLVAWARFEADEARSARRVFARWVVDDADGAPCSVDAECAGGACVQGACCTAPCQAPPPVDAGTEPAPDGGDDTGVSDGGPSGDRRALAVGCGCDTAASLPWGLGVLLGWRWGRRWRRGETVR